MRQHTTPDRITVLAAILETHIDRARYQDKKTLEMYEGFEDELPMLELEKLRLMIERTMNLIKTALNEVSTN